MGPAAKCGKITRHSPPLVADYWQEVTSVINTNYEFTIFAMTKKYIQTYFEASAASSGNKFLQLAEIHNEFAVPPAVSLSSEAFEVSITNKTAEHIEALLNLLKSNGGYGLNRMQQKIQKQLDSIQLPDTLVAEIFSAAEELSENWTHQLIVRSSSSFSG